MAISPNTVQYAFAGLIFLNQPVYIYICIFHQSSYDVAFIRSLLSKQSHLKLIN